MALRFFLPAFFRQRAVPFETRSLVSVGHVLAASFIATLLSFLIPDAELGNRVLHALAGGTVGVSACFLAVRDSGMRIDRFQFAVLSILIVLALGIANELLEFALQVYLGFGFSETVTETWWDLTSNCVGILLGVLLLTPLHKFQKNAYD